MFPLEVTRTRAYKYLSSSTVVQLFASVWHAACVSGNKSFYSWNWGEIKYTGGRSEDNFFVNLFIRYIYLWPLYTGSMFVFRLQNGINGIVASKNDRRRLSRFCSYNHLQKSVISRVVIWGNLGEKVIHFYFQYICCNKWFSSETKGPKIRTSTGSEWKCENGKT